MSDQICNIKIKIQSTDPLCRLDYCGKLSEEDSEFLQSQCESINYMIKKDAELIIQFYQSYRSIEILTNMSAEYDIELCYSSHSMRFKRCILDSIKSIASNGDVIVEVKFICKSKPGLSVEFEHTKFDD